MAQTPGAAVMRAHSTDSDVQTPALAEVHAALLVTMRGWDRRRRRLALLRGVCEGVVVVVIGLGLTIAIDVFWNPWLSVRWIATGMWASSALGILMLRGVIPALRPWDPVHVARYAERTVEIGDERVSSALELIVRPSPGISAWMIARTAALAVQTVTALAPARIFPFQPMRRRVRSAGVAVAVVIVVLVVPQGASWLARAVAPGLPLARPSRFLIQVDPGAAQIARGTPIVITAQISPPPQSAQVLLVWEDGVAESLPLHTDGTSYVLDLPAVSRSFNYRIRADTGESRTYAISVLDPPALEGMLVRVIPPAYSGLPTRESAEGDVEIIAGSRIHIQVTAPHQAVRGVTVLREGQTDLALQPLEDGRWMGQFLPEKSQIYTLRLISADGIVVEPANRWLITVRADQPPEIAVTRVGANADPNTATSTDTTSQAAVDEVLSLAVTATDDNGLRECVLIVAAGGRELLRRDLLAVKTFSAARLHQIVSVDLARIAVDQGDRVQIHVEAVDQGGLRAMSAPLTLGLISSAGAGAAHMTADLRRQLAGLDGALAELRLAERMWTTLLRTFRAEDPAAQRGELLLIGARYAQLCVDVQQAALAIRAVAVRSRPVDHPAQDWILGTAVDLDAWIATQNDPLQRSIQDSTQATTPLGAVQRGRDLVEMAHRALEPLRVALLVAIARLQLDVEVARMDSALRRAQAADMVLRGWAIWREKATEPGLLLSVRQGVDGHGVLLMQAVASPTLGPIQQGGLTANYLAHWQGELFIPTTGMYRFAAEVDDGVRLRCAGIDVFPVESWRSQAKTDFQGRVHLEEGWQPLEIDYFQAEGDAVLALRWNLEGTEPQAFTVAEVRHRPTGTLPAEMIAAMVAVTPASVAQARDALHASGTLAGEVALQLHRIAGESGREFILERAKQADKPAARLRMLSEDSGPEQRKVAIADLQTVVECTRQARDHLAAQVDSHSGAGSPLARVRSMVAQLQVRVEAVQQVRNALPTSDREGVQRRETAAVQAGTVALAQQLDQFREDILVRAGLVDSVLAERLFLLSAREDMAAMAKDSVASAWLAVEEEVMSLHGDTLPSFQSLVKALAMLATRLQDLEEIVMRADDAHFAAEVDRLLVAQVSVANPVQFPVRPESEAASRSTHIQEVAQHFRDHGRWQAARTVQQGMSGSDPRQRQAVVATLVKVPATVPAAAVLAQKALLQARERLLAGDLLAAEPVVLSERTFAMEHIQYHHGDFAREALRAAEITIRLTTLGAGSSGTAGIEWESDMQQLAHDCAVVAQAMIPTVEAVHALELRFKTLIAQIPPASAELLVEPTVGLPQLRYWAKRLAAAVRDPGLRPQIIADMQHLAGENSTHLQPPTAASPTAAPTVLELADAVEQGLEQERATVATEIALRDELSHASRQAAEVFTTASKRLDPRWSAVRQRLVQAANEASRRAELARASPALPGAESIHLVGAILRDRTKFLREVLEPLARAVAEDDAVAIEVSERALAISEAAHTQWDIAQRLALLFAGDMRERVEMARMLAWAEERVGAVQPLSDPAVMQILDEARGRLLALPEDGAAIRNMNAADLRTHLGEQQAIIEALSPFVDSEKSALETTQSTAVLAHIWRTATTMAEVRQEIDPMFSQQLATQAQAAYQLAMRFSAVGVGQSRDVLPLLRAANPAGTLLPAPLPSPAAMLANSASVITRPGAGDASWRHAAHLLSQVQAVEALGIGGSIPADANGHRAHAPPISPDALTAMSTIAAMPVPPANSRMREWLRSAAEANQDFDGPGADQFSEEYQQAIRAYFRRIMAEETP